MGWKVVEDRHPQTRQGGEQAGGGKDASGNFVPAEAAAFAAAERRDELKSPEHQVHGDGGDMDQHGDGRVEEPGVVGGYLTSGQLGHADCTGDHRDEAKEDQGGGHEPPGAGPWAGAGKSFGRHDVTFLVGALSRTHRG